MPCYETTVRRKVKQAVEIPTEQEMKDEVGALDHDDLHRILEKMTDEELSERVKKMLEKRRRKRHEATQRYLAQEARH